MSKSYSMTTKKIPLDDSWDVVVVGGGPSGCTAAASSAREGARTLLIEATGALGGMGTSGLVPAWCPFTDKERIVYSGMGEYVLKQCMAGMSHLGKDCYDWTPIDPERLKRVYDELVTSNGAEVLFNTVLSDVEVGEQGTVEALIVTNKAGLTAIKAKTYVDCTGDADLSVRAGAEYEKGDETGDLQPATHCFALANVDMYAYQFIGGIKYHPKKNAITAMKNDGKYDLIVDEHACNNLVGPGTIGFNAGHIWSVDNTDPHSVSKALITGRKLAAQFRDACAEYAPEAFGNAFLISTGSLMGIRETRRIVGDYVLTTEDFIARRSFHDEICRNCYFIDIHHKKSEIGTIKEGHGDAIHYEKGESHGIPYRCLTPKGLKNVLVAGRSISTDRVVQGSTRVMPVCLVMGEAAGAAAAMAGEDGCDVHAVDTGKLRASLKGHGAYLPELESKEARA